MALKKSIIHKVPLMGEQTFIAYVRVDKVNGSKNAMNASVGFYKDNAEGELIKAEGFEFIPSLESNFIKQAYDHLKTLPEFSGSIDC
jgi:hypothetical protein